jgi:hypothetical protein
MSTLRVGNRFRTNPLSFTSGGADVLVVYKDGSRFLYDKIKFPAHYVAKICPEDIEHGLVVHVYANGEEIDIEQVRKAAQKYLN